MSNGRKIMEGGKKCQIWKENVQIAGNGLSKNEMWSVLVGHIYMCHIMCKGFLDSNFNHSSGF